MTTRSITIGAGVDLDVDRLISTRLLVQANSGGGKSWLLRRLLEQTHGKVQQIVIDPEGEFASLRERYDYVLASRQGGDTLADPRTAKLLAERLLELGVSAILDIYELNPHERIRFVRLFLEALVDAPKHLWHPVLVVIDEAHVFCPEKDEAESAGAVNALCSRGRKRGFCAVLATQRLSKLAKDAAAECNNKLIGRTSLDVDMARAGDELGFSKAARLGLRDLGDGEFFAFGPAMSRAVTRVTVGPVVTAHPKAGSRLAAVVPPPTDKVKALLPKLSDLPAEAEAREKTVADLKAENASLRRDLAEARKAAPKTEQVETPVLTDADRELLQTVADRLIDLDAEMASGLQSSRLAEFQQAIERAVLAAHRELFTAQQAAREAFAALLKEQGFDQVLEKLTLHQPAVHPVSAPRPAPTGRPAVTPAPRPTVAPGRGLTVTAPQQRIINAINWAERYRLPVQKREKIAFLADASPKSSAYINNLGTLRTAGLIDYPQQGFVALTPTGRALAQVDSSDPSTSAELQRSICAKLPAPQARILTALCHVYPRPLTRAALAQQAAASVTSSAFINNIGALRSLGLLDYPQQGVVVASPVLFMEAQ